MTKAPRDVDQLEAYTEGDHVHVNPCSKDIQDFVCDFASIRRSQLVLSPFVVRIAAEALLHVRILYDAKNHLLARVMPFASLLTSSSMNC
jgi:hypothetical protein